MIELRSDTKTKPSPEMRAAKRPILRYAFDEHPALVD